MMIDGTVEIICNGYRVPLSTRYDPYAMIVLENIDTHEKRVYYPDYGEFEFEFQPGRYMIKPWFNMEFVGFKYVDKPESSIQILIVECDFDIYRASNLSLTSP